jgi:hypothetical protein
VYDLVFEKYNLLFCKTVLAHGNYISQEKWVCTDLLQVSETLAEGLTKEGLVELVKNFGQK